MCGSLSAAGSSYQLMELITAALCSQLQLVSSVVRYTLEQRVFLYDTYVKYVLLESVGGKCWRKFRDERVASRQTIHNLVNKLRTTGLLIDKKQKHKRWVLIEKLGDMGARLEHSRIKSLKHLSQETGVPNSSARTSTELLKLRLQKTTVIYALQSRDPANRLIFAIGFNNLSSKVRLICSWHSFLMKHSFTCRDT
jgi:hypothetical protein